MTDLQELFEIPTSQLVDELIEAQAETHAEWLRLRTKGRILDRVLAFWERYLANEGITA